jgi:2-C-methyl-D-erythritol 4-phosphate cytidylyltransferase
MESGLDDNPREINVIVPAAGTGSRMKLAQNKQFLQLGLFPVIIRTLRVLEFHPRIAGYLVVTAAGDLPAMRQLIADHRLSRCLTVTEGGKTRQESVAAGLRALACLKIDRPDSLVLIHDGARCFVTPSVIDRVIDGIIRHQSCGAAIAVKDTIKVAGADGAVRQTLDRSRLWAMQTPQGSRYGLLCRANELARQQGWQATDDLSLLELAGFPVYLVPGDPLNIKLTTPEDLLLGEQLARLADQNTDPESLRETSPGRL